MTRTLLSLVFAYVLGMVALDLLDRDSAGVYAEVMRWSSGVTTVLNVLLGAVIVGGILVAAAIAAEKGHVNSITLRRFAGLIRAAGYRVVPPPTNDYDEAAAMLGLEALGYPVDDSGGFGSVARTSVRRFQRDHGLRDTGWLDPKTVSVLTAAARDAAGLPLTRSKDTPETPIADRPAP